jgi:hypothetical protein
MPFYACRRCFIDLKLEGRRFREAEHWFKTPHELWAHWRDAHNMERPPADDVANSRLEDAQAIANGYIIYCGDIDCTFFKIECLRCATVTSNPEHVQNLYCPTCGRWFENFYTGGPGHREPTPS